MSEHRWGWVKVLCLAWIVAAPLAQAFRGLDMTDTGFLLSNQYWILRDPSAAAFWFHLWLPNILGGLILTIAGPWGVFASKVAAALLFWGLAWAVFRLYGRAVPERWLWVGVAATLFFDFADKINVVHYNNLSVLLYGWGVVLLVEGAATRKVGLFVVAGAVLAANTLVRLPNILGLGLIAVPYLVAWWSRKGWTVWRPGWRPLLAFAAGAAGAALALAGALALLGHGKFYLDSLHALVTESVNDPGTHYGLKQVVGRPLKATLFALVAGAGAGGLLAGLGYLLARLRPGRSRLALTVAAGTAGAVVTALLVHDLRLVASTVAGLVYLSAGLAFFWRADPLNPRVALAGVLSALTVFLLNWGSDTGIAVATYALPLAVPALLLTAGQLPWPWARQARILLVVLLAGYGAIAVASQVYRDVPWGKALVSTEGIGPVLTSPQRARAIEAVTTEIGTLARPGGTVLIVGSLPLFHFLSETKPYLGNPWPDLFTSHQLAVALAAREKTGLPDLIVLSKASGRGSLWPRGSQKPPRAVEEFIARNGFVLATETGEARFFVPKKDAP